MIRQHALPLLLDPRLTTYPPTSGEKYRFLLASLTTTSKGFPQALAKSSQVILRFRITSRAYAYSVTGNGIRDQPTVQRSNFLHKTNARTLP